MFTSSIAASAEFYSDDYFIGKSIWVALARKRNKRAVNFRIVSVPGSRLDWKDWPLPWFIACIKGTNNLYQVPGNRQEIIMPYNSVGDLPESVRNNLPAHAQEIYREAFNHAWTEYADPAKRRGDASQEETAHRVAWAAVKETYVKDEKTGEWKKR